MKAVIQRVSYARVSVDDNTIGQIGLGLLILLGIEDGDNATDAAWLAKKITRMRIFSDGNGKMNLDLSTTGGELLVISQFTLHASTKKGARPSYIKAARPEKAIPLYEEFISECNDLTENPVQCGEFGANMKVELLNDGPLTIIIDSQNRE